MGWRTRWHKDLPFWGVHVAALVGALWAGWSWTAFVWLTATYAIRMFAITAGYHRYFSHRTYKTSRAFQLFLALLGMSTLQQGPLWWAGRHRHHHKTSDTPDDVHSPVQRGFWYAHVGWIFAERQVHREPPKDLAAFPELRFMDRHDNLFVVGYALLTYAIGGGTALAWGFFVSVVVAWHATFAINSLAHVFGRRRYRTSDESRNGLALALLTFGEGWHNNHHHYQRSARQGFRWYEIDVSYYVLKLLEVLRIVSDVQGVPDHVRDDVPSPVRARLAVST